MIELKPGQSFERDTLILLTDRKKFLEDKDVDALGTKILKVVLEVLYHIVKSFRDIHLAGAQRSCLETEDYCVFLEDSFARALPGVKPLIDEYISGAKYGIKGTNDNFVRDMNGLTVFQDDEIASIKTLIPIQAYDGRDSAVVALLTSQGVSPEDITKVIESRSDKIDVVLIMKEIETTLIPKFVEARLKARGN